MEDFLVFLAVIIVLWVLFAPLYILTRLTSLRKKYEALSNHFNQLSKSHRALLKRELDRDNKAILSDYVRPLAEAPTYYPPVEVEKEPVQDAPEVVYEQPEPVLPVTPEPTQTPEPVSEPEPPVVPAPAPAPIEEVKVPAPPEDVLEPEAPVITLGQVSAPERAGTRKEMYAPSQKVSPVKKKPKPAPQAPSWLTILGDNWLGIAGATVLVLGLVFLGVYAASSFGPAPRFLMLLGVGGLLVGGGFLLRKKEVFKPAVGYLRASGGAVWLFACLGAGGLPSLQFIQEPFIALGLLLIGVIVNLYLGFFGKTQTFSALHVVLSLVALAAAQHFAGRAEIALFGAGLLVAAYGIALSFRFRWPWHLLILVFGYAIFHANWFLYASDFFDIQLNLIQNIAGGGGTVLVAVLAALTHYQPRYKGSSSLGLPGRIHGINWLLALINIAPHSLGGQIAPFALTAAGIGLFVLARYARKLDIHRLFLTDTLVALLLLCGAAISLTRLGTSPFVILILLVLVMVAAGWLFLKEKESTLAVISQFGLAVIGLGTIIFLLAADELQNGVIEVVLFSLSAIAGIGWLTWVHTQESSWIKSNEYFEISRRFALMVFAMFLPGILVLTTPLWAMIVIVAGLGMCLTLAVHITKDRILSYANLAAMLVSIPVLFLRMEVTNGSNEIGWLLPLLSITGWSLSAAFLHPDKKESTGIAISSIVAGFAVSLLIGYYYQQSWVMWIGAAPIIAMRWTAFQKQWNGLLSGIVVILLAMTGIGLYHIAFIQSDFTLLDYLIFSIPMLLVAGIEAFASERSESIPYPKWSWIYLAGGVVMLSSFLLLRPLSGLLPGVMWLGFVPIIIVIAKEFQTRLAGRHKHLLLAAGVMLLAFFARHFTIHLGSSLHLSGVPVRAIIGMLGVAVMVYQLVFERNKDWDHIRFWKKGHAMLLEASFLLFVITLAFEMKVPYWQPIAWSVLAIVSLMLGTVWKEGSRLRLYGLLCSWAAAFQIAILSSVAILPSSSMSETPWFTAIIGLGILIGFVVVAYRLLKLDEIDFPFKLTWLQDILATLQKRPLPWLVLPVSIGAAIFFYFAFEKSQLTLLWMVEALVLFALAIFLREPYFRYISLAIVAVCMIRLPLFDLTNASLLGRALSFIGVGVMLMAMDLIYRRFGRRMEE